MTDADAAPSSQPASQPAPPNSEAPPTPRPTVAELRRRFEDPVARAEEAERVRMRKRPSNDDAEDGSHEPGQAASASSAAPDPPISTPATSTVPPTAASTKRRAEDEPDVERPNAFQCTDELAQIARGIMRQADIVHKGDDTVASREVRQHPGPIVRRKDISTKERQWQDIGSGVFARTFPQSERLLTTTRGGPPIDDVHRRTIWSLSKGRIIDDCLVDDVPDKTLNRWLDEPDDIRVELTMKNALSMYHRSGADVAEIYSQPRIAQAAAEFDKNGVTLQPGWSLDLTRADPSTGRAWDLSKGEVRSRVMRLVRSTRPLF